MAAGKPDLDDMRVARGKKKLWEQGRKKDPPLLLRLPQWKVEWGHEEQSPGIRVGQKI